jgi:hypothetical protein
MMNGPIDWIVAIFIVSMIFSVFAFSGKRR